MLAIALAVLSSVAYGCADFLGGIAGRRAHVLRVVAVAAPVSLVAAVAPVPWLGATWSASALGWGGASGIASALSFALLYRTLAIGPMSVLSPVTALVSAVLPVVVGLVQGERLGVLALVGVPVALVAVVLVSASPGGLSRPTRDALLLAVGAGTAIAVQLVCLHQAPTGSGLAPLVAGRLVATVLVLAAVAALRARPQDGAAAAPVPLAIAAGAGALDELANLAFLLAARAGDLAVVAVVTALYPAATVLLARGLLGERVARSQLGGLAAAAVAVALLATG